MKKPKTKTPPIKDTNNCSPLERFADADKDEFGLPKVKAYAASLDYTQKEIAAAKLKSPLAAHDGRGQYFPGRVREELYYCVEFDDGTRAYYHTDSTLIVPVKTEITSPPLPADPPA